MRSFNEGKDEDPCTISLNLLLWTLIDILNWSAEEDLRSERSGHLKLTRELNLPQL